MNITRIATTFTILSSAFASVHDVRASGIDPEAARCYQQTVLAAQQVAPDQLSTRSCTRALRRGPHTDAHKSSVYHNRAIIELAQGNPAAARASLEKAVELAASPGIQHVALAQLAYREGDIARAGSLYEQALEAVDTDDRLAPIRDQIERNLALIERLRQDGRIARRTP